MIRIDVVDTGVQAALRALQQRVGNLQPAMKEIGDAVVAQTALRFKSSGPSPEGVAWAPLSPATIKARRKGPGKGTAQPLLDTGRLRNSITRRLQGRNSVEIGTNVKYAAIHQFGGTINIAARSQQAYFKQYKNGTVGNRFVKKSKSNFAQWHTRGAHTINIPARPFLGLSSSDRAEVIDILRRRIMEATA